MDPPVVSAVADIVLAGAAVLTAFYALEGLTAWRRQLCGAAEYDVARRLLRAAYRLRNAIRVVRHPAMFVEELTADARVNVDGDALYARYLGVATAYERRWKGVTDAEAELATEALEGEVLWGKQLTPVLARIYELDRELWTAVRDHLVMRNPRESVDRQAMLSRRSLQRRDVLYDSLNEQEGDPFRDDYDLAIASLENVLRHHIHDDVLD